MTTIAQKTLLEEYPQDLVRVDYGFTPEENTQVIIQKEPLQELLERQRGQKSDILGLLMTMDRVPVTLLQRYPQYNARINELNKYLAKLDPPMEINSYYDPETEEKYYKRLEVIYHASKKT